MHAWFFGAPHKTIIHPEGFPPSGNTEWIDIYTPVNKSIDHASIKIIMMNDSIFIFFREVHTQAHKVLILSQNITE